MAANWARTRAIAATFGGEGGSGARRSSRVSLAAAATAASGEAPGSAESDLGVALVARLDGVERVVDGDLDHRLDARLLLRAAEARGDHLGDGVPVGHGVGRGRPGGRYREGEDDDERHHAQATVCGLLPVDSHVASPLRGGLGVPVGRRLAAAARQVDRLAINRTSTADEPPPRVRRPVVVQGVAGGRGCASRRRRASKPGSRRRLSKAGSPRPTTR